MEKVYVVTNVEAGWDCVYGVFKSFNSLKEFFRNYYEFLEDKEENYYFESLTEENFEEYVSNSPRTEMFIIHKETIQ